MSFLHTKKFYYYTALITPISVAIQMVLGSLVQGTESGLSCPDWPLCYNQLIPINVEAIVYIEFIHRVFASLVSLLIFLLLYLTYYHRSEISSRILAKKEIDNNFEVGSRRLKLMKVISILLIIQILFGGLTVLLKLDPIVVVIHLSLATTILVATIFLFVDVKPYPQ